MGIFSSKLRSEECIYIMLQGFHQNKKHQLEKRSISTKLDYAVNLSMHEEYRNNISFV